jgi:hypothetical protein
VDGHSRYVVASDLDLTGVQTGPHLHAESTHGVSDGAGAVNGAPTGAIEGGFEPVP